MIWTTKVQNSHETKRNWHLYSERDVLMKKSNNCNLSTNCSKHESKNINAIGQQVEEQSVQQRYHKELIKYQEQINKTKRPSSRDNQAA